MVLLSRILYRFKKKLAFVVIFLCTISILLYLNINNTSNNNNNNNNNSNIIINNTKVGLITSSHQRTQLFEVNTHEREHQINDYTAHSGIVNYDKWVCPPFVGYYVDDLRLHHHDWPAHPTIKGTENKIQILSEKLLHFGAKMYGYLLPLINGGKYVFSVKDKSHVTALSIEVWLSHTPYPKDLIKVYNVTKGGIYDKSNSGTAGNRFTFNLIQNQTHYFEFHIKSFKGQVNVEIQWKPPHEKEFVSVPPSHLSMAVNFNSTQSYLKFNSFNFPSNNIQTIRYIKPHLDDVTNVISLSVLQKCDYTPSFVRVGPVEHFKGYYKVKESGTYPWDLNRYVYINKSIMSGNTKITKSDIDLVYKLYEKQFLKANLPSYTLIGVHCMDETIDYKLSGSRFLLEMDIKLDNGEVKHTSEYVFMSKKNKTLCQVLNFEWRQDVFVYVVVSVKDLAPWIIHLIHNFEDIYDTTKDDNFQLIIVDYNSTDINITDRLTKSSLPHWKVIILDGKFSRSGGLQAGIDYVTDSNSLIMTIDMHLTLPKDFIANIRKHTIQGRMAYAPMFFKLSEGYSENNVNGYWQIGTYGLFGMYKSDWNKVGGFDVINYKYKWGGEDWDLLDRTVAQGIEVFRSRPPGLFHYYHTRAGMWGVRSNNGC